GVERARDRIARHVTPAERRDAVARYDIQRANRTQLIDQRLRQSVGEIAERAVAAVIGEVEHRDTILRERAGAAARAAVAAPQQQPRAGDEHNHANADSDVPAPSPRELRATR